MQPSRRVSLLLLSALAASCAGPAQLAKQSERALREGDLVKAYDLASRGVEKDPGNAAARSALSVAAAQRVDAAKARVLDLAAADTLAAARAALELRDFRAEVQRRSVALPEDPRYAARENAIVQSAASAEYRKGEESLAAHRPKEAYGHYRVAESFVASYGDLQERLQRARQQAITRVALLPFENDVHVPGLSRALLDDVYRTLAQRAKGLLFTELVSPDEVYATMTVKELESLPPEATWRVATGVEAVRVVTGRVHGLRASTNTFSFQYPIYHKVADRDTSGRLQVRWEETRFDAIARERQVTVDWDVRVLDARTHAELARSTKSYESVARVAWTDYRADGSCDDYRLMPPDREDGEEGRRVHARWEECFGTWTLPDMLEQSRRDRHRSLYQSGYRDEFRADSRRRPVLCGELPGEDDMTVIALEEAWRPVLDVLKRLDVVD
jgi:hypothetical protein